MIREVTSRDDLVFVFKYAQKLINEIGRCVISISKDKKGSDKQRRYYFGVVVPEMIKGQEEHDKLVGAMARESGYTVADMHQTLKDEILGTKEFVDPNGKVHTIFPSYKNLTSEEREDYHEHCRRIAGEWYGIIVPLPNEVIE